MVYFIGCQRNSKKKHLSGGIQVPGIKHTVEIKAAPESVYDLITQVEDFCLYSKLIKSIKAIKPYTYHWTARVAGVTLDWDAVVTEDVRPRRFAWQSTSGFTNSGCYTLKPSETGTVVSFEMEYHLSSSILEKATLPFTSPFFQKVTNEILTHVKERLEGGEKKD